VWLEAWSDVLRILDKAGMRSIQEFDDRFQGSQSLFNWIQDLEDELWKAGLEDRQFLSARIAVCEEGLRRFRTDDDLVTENRRRALAESYNELGETDKAEALYRDWLQLDTRGVGDGLVGRIATDSRARNGPIGGVANRSCGKGWPSRRSGIVQA
jgi:hypothetical protein